MHDRPASPWPLILGAIGVGASAAAIALAILERDVHGQPPVAELLAQSVTSVGMVCIGGLLARRRRDSPLGWLIIAIGVETALSQLSYRYGLRYFLKPGVTAPRPASSSTTEHLEDTLDTVLATFLFVLFPTGRPSTRRWHFVLYGIVGLGAVSIVARLLVPGQLADLPGVQNPFGVAAVAHSARTVRDVSLPVLNVMFLLAGASVFTRWRKAGGVERQQLKCLAIAATVLALLLVTGNLADAGALGPALAPLGHAFFFAVLLVPSAVTIAVLRYRLHDIDVVISRAIVLAALAGFITSVYVVVVVGFGQLLSTSGRPNALLSIAATALTALAFQPVRSRATAFANRLVYGQRATPYEVLSKLVEHFGDLATPEEQLDRVARLLAGGTGGAVRVWLRVGDEVRPVAAWPEGAPHGGPEEKVAVVHHDETLGYLGVTKVAAEPISAADRRLMRDVAAQAGLLLRNARLNAELRERIELLRVSRQRLVSAQDEERRRLERDLHDGAQQQLVGLKIKLSIAGRVARRELATETEAVLVELVGEAADAVQTLRDLAHGIYPPLLAAEGLAAALEAQAQKAIVPVEIEAANVARYGQDVEATVYFCCLEALQNVVKYASASKVRVAVVEDGGALRFSVIDDGAGFDETVTRRGAGLQNMADRVDAVFGTLTVSSAPGCGTTVAGRIPLETAART